MQRFTEIQAKADSLDDLLQIVGALRSLAAARLQEARSVLAGVHAYSAAVEETLLRARNLVEIKDQAVPSVAGKKTLAIAFLSEHGFVGGFNGYLLDALTSACDLKTTEVIVTGTRGAVAATERGCRVVASYLSPSHADGGLPLARQLTDDLFVRMAKGNIGKLLICFATPGMDAEWSPVVKNLLPLAPLAHGTSKYANPPLVHVHPARLVKELVDEWLFSTIMNAQMDSFACENAARLLAMESAHANVARKGEQYRQQARVCRQDEITTELFDIVLGAEAAL